MKYSYLEILLDGYSKLDGLGIQKSVNRVLKAANFPSNFSTENYAYTFAKAFYERTRGKLFVSTGEVLATPASDDGDAAFVEGRRFLVLVEAVERDGRARAKCIEHFGAWCRVCEFDFEKTYGSIGRGYIHVHHHKMRMADTPGPRVVDQIADLIPVCPNCHAMAHAKPTMWSIDELRKLVAQRNAQRKGN